MVRRPRLSTEVLCGGSLYRNKTGYGVHCAACGDRTDPRRLREIGRTVGLLGDDDGQEAS